MALPLRCSLLAFALVACGPGGTYCQTGPKHGTECYAAADVETEQRRQGRAPPPEAWSERWNRFRAPTASAPVQASSAGVPGAASAAQRSVDVSFLHGTLESESAGREEARRVAARRYAAALADWLERSWGEVAAAALPCFEEEPHSASVRLHLDGAGRVTRWQWSSRPEDTRAVTAVERTAGRWLGETIPSPPPVFGDLQPRSLDVELSNRGFACGR